MDKKIGAFIRKYEFVENSGISIAILKANRPIYESSFGWSDRASKKPVTTQTLFSIGSCTKAFTSFALAILQERGVLSLTTPVQNYLPAFSLENHEIAKQVTLEDMLSHRVGLPRHDFLWYFTDFKAARILEALPHLEMNKRPAMVFRKSMQYNNIMYLAAGKVLERMSHTLWEDMVRQLIFTPLQMNDSEFSYNPKPSVDFAKPYAGDKELKPHSLDNVAPAGGIYSSVDDLVDWVRMLNTNGLSPRGEQLLSVSATQDLWKERSRTEVEGKLFRYGLGWTLSEVAGTTIIWHSGAIDGYMAHVSFEPIRGLGLIILTNQNAASQFASLMKHQDKTGKAHFLGLPYYIYELLLDPQHEPELPADKSGFEPPPFDLIPAPPQTDDKPDPNEDRTDPFGLWAYRGIYSHAGYGFAKVSQRGGKLFVKYYNLESILIQVANDLYMGAVTSVPKMPFVASFERAKGKVEALKLSFESDVSPIVFQRITESAPQCLRESQL